MNIEFDMYQTLALAVLVLLLGSFLKKHIHFLEKFCIPAPVIGGLLFAILTCIGYSTGLADFTFDDTLREVCMVFFFTSVGFQANLKVLKSGGKSMIIFLFLVITLIVSQNLLAVGLSKLLQLNPLVGMCTGSIPMVGGHGTAGAFGPVLEDFNIQGATTICTAAATFGLIMGSLIGGPIGKRLIEKRNLMDTVATEDDSLLIEDEEKHKPHTNMYAAAVFQLILAIGLGTIFSWLLTKTGLTFPIYIGAMLAALIEISLSIQILQPFIWVEINDLGGISLSLCFWNGNDYFEVMGVSFSGTSACHLLARRHFSSAYLLFFVIFRIMGHDYDAAVLAAGTCGFGMGATPKYVSKYAGLMRPLCTIGKSLSADSTGGKSVRRFYQQFGYYIFINII